jgi:hypothetical protein
MSRVQQEAGRKSIARIEAALMFGKGFIICLNCAPSSCFWFASVSGQCRMSACGSVSLPVLRLPALNQAESLFVMSQKPEIKKSVASQSVAPKYPGIRVTCNGNQLVAQWVETRITDGGIYYPITPSTEGGEIYQSSYAMGELNVWGGQKVAVETEGEHAAQGGATAFAVSGKRAVNFTSGQGIAYAMEQYYHAPGKFCTMVIRRSSCAKSANSR